MPIPTTTIARFREHLQDLNLQDHRNVVVHSRLVSFGRIEGGVPTVHESLTRSVGSGVTIAVPTYTFELGEGRAYDPLLSPSIGVGALSEYLRQQSGAIRSSCPLHNHAALGPAAMVLSAVTGLHSMGPLSDFEALRNKNFSLLLLGCGFHEGATFLHHLEAMIGVPYRRWVELPRRRVVDGVEELVVVRYYARAMAGWTEDFDRVRAGMEEAGLLRVAPCPFGRSYLTTLRAIEEFVAPLLRHDPYALVRRSEGPE